MGAFSYAQIKAGDDMFKPVKMPVSKDPAPGEWKLESLNGGIVYTDSPQKILDNQSPNMLNMWFKERALTKRYGQENLFASLGSFPILSIYNKLFNGKVIFTASTNMYSLDLTTKTTTLLYSTLTAAKGRFFVVNGILYYLNGNEYVRYDGTTVSAVVGYVPLVITGRAPTGGGTVNEQYNRIQAGFKTSFSGNGTATVYTLPQTGLDATTVTATVGGVAKTEGTDFTVDRVNGLVTFTVAPASGTDNVVITAYKTDSVGKTAILTCKYATTFGGNNDSRVFLAGDSTTYYYSGLLDPTFWPENQYNNAGVDNTNITGFGKQYNVLVVFKERSLFAVTYSFNGTTASFPLAELNNSVGCDMPYTIQLINNRLTWCTTYAGPQTLVSTILKDEKNVRAIGENIRGTGNNPGLLNQAKADLQKATSVDAYGHYWLCIGSLIWAWNYEISPFADTGDPYADQVRLAWFPFDTVNANCWIAVDQDLYYGDRTSGVISHFIKNNNDFGVATNARWRSKILNFNVMGFLITILGLWFNSSAKVGSSISIKHTNDNGDILRTATIPAGKTASFTWAKFNWAAFTWGVPKYFQQIPQRVVLKNIPYYQVEFSNNNTNQNLVVSDLRLLYVLGKQVR